MFKRRKRLTVDLELVFVHDENGWEQVPDENEWYIWAHPELYTWVNFAHDGPVMLYFFEFTG